VKTEAPTHPHRTVRRIGSALLPVLLFIALVAVRSVLVVSAVKVHNDERHYALDGFWVKADLPAATVWGRLLRGHMSEHLAFNPRTDELKRHGEFTKGFHDAEDDLLRFPRAGHPPLYMMALGALFTPISERWLHAADRYVVIARVFNTVLDCLTWLMLFQLLRRLIGRQLARWVVAPLLLLPYVLVIGSLGYLDGPGTFMLVLCAWVYVARVRDGASLRWWGLLGLLLGAGVMVKQSNVFALPLLAATALVWPPGRRLRDLRVPLALAGALFAATIFAGCNPFDLVSNTMGAVERTRVFGASRFVEQEGHLRLVYLADPTRHYHFGVTEARPRSYLRSALLIRAHNCTFPVLLAAFVLAVLLLAALRRWRALALPLVIAAITVVIPFGSNVRRLYLLLPFVVLTIGLALFELRQRRSGAAGT